MKKLICCLAVLILSVCISAALAASGTVTATASVNIRKGPGLGYDTIGSINKGMQLDYMGDTQADDRGVDWYRVDYKGNTDAWVSSTYAALETSAAAAADSSVSDDIYRELTAPTGVLTPDGIRSWYGTFDLDELINTTGYSISASGDMQSIDAYFGDDVYWGGTDGYYDDWLASDGIMSEKFADIDADGADEYIILYMDCQFSTEYGYEHISHKRYVAIFEPVDGGYAYADSFPISNASNCEYSFRLISGEHGMRLADCFIAYWDGGSCGTQIILYGYDGRSAFIDFLAYPTSYDGYVLTMRFDPDMLDSIYTLCSDYEYDKDAANAAGIIEGENFFFSPMSYADFYDENGRICREQLCNFDKCASAVRPYGLETGYNIDQHSDYDHFSLYINGGQILLHTMERWDNGSAYMHMELCSTLDHTSGSASSAVTPAGWDTPAYHIVSAGNSDPAYATVLTDDMLGKVLAVQDTVGGWFALTAPADGDYQFSVYAPELTGESFTIAANINGERFYELYFTESSAIQTGIIPGVKKGDRIAWWDCDDSGRWWTLLDPFRLMITCIPSSAVTPTPQPVYTPEPPQSVTPEPPAAVGDVVFNKLESSTITTMDLAIHYGVLYVGWNADNATKYRVKAILIDGVPDNTENQAASALDTYCDSIETTNYISIPVEKLRPNCYVKVAVQALDDNGNTSANWPWVGFRIIDSRFTADGSPVGAITGDVFDTAFQTSAYYYNDMLFKESARFSLEAYNENECESGLKALGFHDIMTFNYTSNYTTGYSEGHYIAFTLGWKDVLDEHGYDTRLFAVICRGTIDTAEWVSNFNSGTGNIHFGIDLATADVYNYLCSYMSVRQHPNASSMGDCKIWLTGHSRGGGVINIMVGEYLKWLGIAETDTYAYTFASPAVVKGPSPSTFISLRNYVLGGDLVPRVPLSHWGYYRYGQTVIIDNPSIAPDGTELNDAQSTGTVCAQLYDMVPTVEEYAANVYPRIEEILTSNTNLITTAALEQALRTVIGEFFIGRYHTYEWASNFIDTHLMETYLWYCY